MSAVCVKGFRHVTDLPLVPLFVDSKPPVVEKVELIGSTQGVDKGYFQSHDALKIKLTIDEVSGLFFTIDVDDIINDADTTYPATEFTNAGLATFSEESCEQNSEGKWECILETAPMKSGTGEKVEFEILVQDTAGNSQ